MMNIKRFSALASLAVLTTGIIVGVEPAQALILETGSTINIAGDATFSALGIDSPVNGEPLSTIDFLNFTGAQPAFPGTGEFVITGGTGSFAGFAPVPPDFQTGTIKDLPTAIFPFGDPNNLNGFVPTDDFLVFSDQSGNNVNFDLVTLNAPVYSQSGSGAGASTSVTISATGNFDSDMSTDVDGSFVFAAEFVGRTADEVRDILRTPGGTLDGESNSGNGIINEVDIPEPTSMLGLVAFGLASAGVLGRKKQKQTV